MVGWWARGRCCPPYTVSTQKAIEHVFNCPTNTHPTEQICFIFIHQGYNTHAILQLHWPNDINSVLHMASISLVPLKQNPNLFTCHSFTIHKVDPWAIVAYKTSRTATNHTQTSLWMKSSEPCFLVSGLSCKPRISVLGKLYTEMSVDLMY